MQMAWDAAMSMTYEYQYMTYLSTTYECVPPVSAVTPLFRSSLYWLQSSHTARHSSHTLSRVTWPLDGECSVCARNCRRPEIPLTGKAGTRESRSARPSAQAAGAAGPVLEAVQELTAIPYSTEYNTRHLSHINPSRGRRREDY